MSRWFSLLPFRERVVWFFGLLCLTLSASAFGSSGVGKRVDLASSRAPLKRLLPNLKANLNREACRKALEEATDTVVEVEPEFGREILPLLTTETGTVGPLLKRRLPPQWLERLAKDRGVRYPSQVLWDDLSRDQQLSLVQYVYRFPRPRQGNVLKELMFRRSVRLWIGEQVTFFGMTYDRGWHDIDLSLFLEPEVESVVAKVRTIKRLEMHFRFRAPWYVVKDSALAFLGVLGLHPTGIQIHGPRLLPPIFGPHPFQRHVRPVLSGLHRLFLDTYRRMLRWQQAELMAHMFDVMQPGGRGRISLRTYRKWFMMKPLEWSQLGRSLLHFVSYPVWQQWRGQEMPRWLLHYRLILNGFDRLGIEAKAAWVGLRGFDFYRAPHLWGPEYRFIRMAHGQEDIRILVDAMEQRWELPMTKAEKKWSKVYQGDLSYWSYLNPTAQRLKMNWYQGFIQSYESEELDMFKYYPPLADLAEGAQEEITKRIHIRVLYETFINKFFPNHLEIKWFYHDWSQDAVLFEKDPTVLERVLRAARGARTELGLPEIADIPNAVSTQATETHSLVPAGQGDWWERGTDPKVQQAVRRFLCESGLYMEYARLFDFEQQARSRCEDLGFTVSAHPH